MKSYGVTYILASDLDPTMVMVGASGGRAAIYAVARTPDMVEVETEHGVLYLDPDDGVNVLHKEADECNE